MVGVIIWNFSFIRINFNFNLQQFYLLIFLKYCKHNNYLPLHSICSLQYTIQEIDNPECPSKTYRQTGINIPITQMI